MLLPHELAAMKLGCVWHPSAAPIRAGAVEALPPAAWGRIVGTPRVAGHNNLVGDCVEVMACNAVQTRLAANGLMGRISDDYALSLYSVVTGYRAGNPATDLGTQPEVMFGWWHARAVAGWKLQDAVTLDPKSETDIRDTISTLGGVCLIVALATEQQNQIVWSAAGKPGTWGMHAVWCDQYEGALTWGTSWGQAQPIDRSYFDGGFVVGAYALELAQ